MITKKAIQELYKKYRKAPESPDFLDMPLLFDYASKYHDVTIDMDGTSDTLVIHSIDCDSPFHRIALTSIHAFVPFEDWLAIVLHSSIIFLNRNCPKVSINIRTEPVTLMERIKGMF
ncbi:MAG: hypothetical protein J1F05_05795 [Muribaculaceae bacterium]|nr:hypothetical protein [Muribaculaceae bacterium]